MEMTVKKYRSNLGCIYNLSYAVGAIVLPVFAYFSTGWRNLSFILCVPSFFLVIHCWFITESPRWLLSQGKKRAAYKLIKGIDLPELDNVSDEQKATEKESKWKKVLSAVQNLFKLFANLELAKRVLICYFTWFTASLCYYVISKYCIFYAAGFIVFVLVFNGGNIDADKYVYVALNGVAEAPGYLIPLAMLPFMGRKLSSIILFFLSAAALMLILAVPTGWPAIAYSLFARMGMSAVFAIVILHTTELFPTINRNTAVSTSLTWAQVGIIFAPSIVENLGKIAYYIPSTFCGILSLVAGVFTLLLPETRNRPMLDTMEEVKTSDVHKPVGFKNCCSFK